MQDSVNSGSACCCFFMSRGLCLSRPWKLLTTKRGTCDEICFFLGLEGWRQRKAPSNLERFFLFSVRPRNAFADGHGSCGLHASFWSSLKSRNCCQRDVFPDSSSLVYTRSTVPGFRVDSWPLFKDSTPHKGFIHKHQYGHSAQGTLLLKSLLPCWLLGKILWQIITDPGWFVQTFWTPGLKNGRDFIPAKYTIHIDMDDMGGDVFRGCFFLGILRSLPWVTLHFALCQWQCLGMSWWRKTRSGVESRWH